MLCSLAFVVAALAVTLIAAEPIDGATRALPNTRLARRSPSPLYPDYGHGGIGCYICGGNGFTQTSMTSIYSQSQYASFSGYASASGFAAGNGIFPSMGQSLGSFNTWSGGMSGLAVFSNTMFGWANYIQSTQISTSIIVTSFTNMIQSLSIFVSQFQGLGAFGGGAQFIHVYAQCIVSVQGLLIWIASSIGIQTFIGLCGPIWQRFVSVFSMYMSFGQQWNFFQGSFFASSGINIAAFQSWGFGLQAYAGYQQASSISVGTFGGAISTSSFGGFPLSGYSSVQGSSFTAASSSSSSSVQSGGGFGYLRN